MKIIARIFGVCIMLIMTSMMFLEMMGITIRQDELNNCISSAVATTQVIMKENIEDKVYGTEAARNVIESNDEYLQLFKTNLEKAKTSNTKYTIRVYGVDYTKGYLDVGVEATYPMINGAVRTLTSRQTNLIEVYEGEQQPVYGNAPDKFSYTGIYDYTGAVQKWTAPKSGKYMIEVWGASSGRKLADNTYRDTTISYGGYSVGYLSVENGEELYIAVGGQGKDGIFGIAEGGWNGGGSGEWDHNDDEAIAGAGGATSITTSLIGDGQLKNYESVKSTDVVIVAGGGGSQVRTDITSASSGGGISGNDGLPAPSSSITLTVPGATQTTGYKFGEGESSKRNVTLYWNSETGAGGGGWYGGCSPADIGAQTFIDGSGGSGYIGYSKLFGNGDGAPKHMAGYDVATSDDPQTKTISVHEASATAETDKAKIGNGAVRITYINENQTGSPSYEPLMKLVSDNDGNHIVSIGDIVETTDKFYAEVMALTGYLTNTKLAYTEKDKYTDDAENWKYDGTDIDKKLNIDYYNMLSNLTKSALRQYEIYQSCYDITATDSGSLPEGTDTGGNPYYMERKSSLLVGKHEEASKLGLTNTVGNKKYVYLPDVDSVISLLGSNWTSSDLDSFFSASNEEVWTRSVTPSGKAIKVSGTYKTLTTADVNSDAVKGSVRPTLQIDKTAIVVSEYSWGGDQSQAAPYKAKLKNAGLQEVEYIEGTGTQWLDTGVVSGKKTWFDLDWSASNATKDYLFMVGSWSHLSVGTKNGQLVIATGETEHNSPSNYQAAYAIQDGERNRIQVGQGYAVYNGNVLMNTEHDNLIPPQNQRIIVFGNSCGGKITEPYIWDTSVGSGSGRIYSLSIYEGKFGDSTSSNVLRKFVPVKKTDGSSAGLYDIQNDKYYSLNGTGYNIGPNKS